METGDDENWSLLAGLRFFLAFIVINGHIGFFRPSVIGTFFDQFGGKAAVVGFLVISGYSVSASMARKRDGFLRRRFLRIYPVYGLVILYAAILQYIVGAQTLTGLQLQPSSPVTLAGNLFLVQSYLVPRIEFDPPVWSLSIEFSFYILLVFMHRINKYALVFAGVFSFLFFLLPIDLSEHRIYQLAMKANMVRYLWPFLIGVYLFKKPPMWHFVVVAAVGSLACALSPTTYEPLSWVTFLIVIIAVAATSRNVGRPQRWLDYLGDLSYPLYLVHFPLWITMFAVWQVQDSLIYMIAAMIASVILTSVIEAPVRRRLARGLLLGQSILQARATPASP
jgi:peptidoglycan/LPS O-acetylase OafA/YrhL